MLLYFAQDEIPPFARCRTSYFTTMVLNLIRLNHDLVDWHDLHIQFIAKIDPRDVEHSSAALSGCITDILCHSLKHRRHPI